MKKLLLFLVLLLATNAQTLTAQQLDINEKTIIKDIDGKKISLNKFAELMNSGEWTITQEKDDKGNSYIQLKKASEEEREMFKKMLEKQLDKSNVTGEKAPSFSLTDINGNNITSENTKGKVVVINFWFIACKPCVSEIPDLNKVYDKYKDNTDVVFASITFDQKPKVEKFLKKHPIKYPVIADDRTTITNFGINGYPTNMVIGKDGNYASSLTGGFPKVGEYIDKAIAKALKAKE